jgi:hypothetical protein
VSPKIKESIDRVSNSSIKSPPDENWLKLYNPTNNTINLSRLTQALQYQTPIKNGPSLTAYGRSFNSTPAEESTLNEILNKTL